MAEPKARSGRRGGRAERLKTRHATTDILERGDPNYTRQPEDSSVCVIACGALAHEILDVLSANSLDHISLTCLPAKLHNEPQAIVPAMEKAIADARKAGFETIFCGYADCGTGGALDRLLEREKVARLPGAHCYAFFSGVPTFEERAEEDMRAFFLTDFLATHFDNLTWRPLGLDRHPELIDAYFGSYEKIVFLAQNENTSLIAKAQEIAERLSLKFEHRQTGFGDLATSLKSI